MFQAGGYRRVSEGRGYPVCDLRGLGASGWRAEITKDALGASRLSNEIMPLLRLETASNAIRGGQDMMARNVIMVKLRRRRPAQLPLVGRAEAEELEATGRRSFDRRHETVVERSFGRQTILVVLVYNSTHAVVRKARTVTCCLSTLFIMEKFVRFATQRYPPALPIRPGSASKRQKRAPVIPKTMAHKRHEWAPQEHCPLKPATRTIFPSKHPPPNQPTPPS